MKPLRLALPALLALVSACGPSQPADPGGLTPSESQALNEAAAVLDADAITIDAVTGNTVSGDAVTDNQAEVSE